MPTTILVVDDDTSFVHLLKEDLEQDGYSVRAGYDGQAALQLAQSAKPHLIIMDVNMPAISGLQTLEQLRAKPETNKIPILFLSGEDAGDLAPALKSAFRVAHLKKPINLEQFNALVRDLVAKYPL